MVSLPRTIGPYAVREEIGRGGMGIVYAAHDDRLKRDVAIKSLSSDLARDQRRIAQFKHEAQIIAQLNHPNIVQVFQFLELDGHAYLVLEHLPGQSLAQMIKLQGPLGVQTTLAIAAQIARAVEAAHGCSICHRDLKPGNVRIKPDGTAKILDFGLAQGGPGVDACDCARPAIPLAPDPHALPRGGGTPGYMAPEQIHAQPADGRADIFSLGCIIYECLTAERAFPGDDLAAIIHATLHHEPDLTRMPDDLPAQIDQLLRSCLTKSPDQRPARIKDVRIQLEIALGRSADSSSHPTPLSGLLRNVPHPRTSFIGRERVLSRLARVITTTRLVTLIGPGGGGKTRLAVELASHVADRFGDGVYWIELASIRAPEFIVDAVASALDVEDQPKTPTIETIVAHLSGKSILLIFDNCEHVLDSAAEIVDRLLRATQTIHVLTTTRQRLLVQGEHLQQIGGLSLPDREDHTDIAGADAVKLFIDRARMVHPDFSLTSDNAATLARICRRLDGAPLAIEFAAARTRTLDPAQIEAHLSDRFRLLVDDSLGTADRFRTLRAAVDWSYDLLSESERHMLPRLSVFAGGWSLESAAAICAPGGNAEDATDLDLFSVIDLLSNLVDKSLVQVDTTRVGATRYSLLATIREYAAEKLEQRGESPALISRHLSHFLDHVEHTRSHFDDASQAESLAHIELDHENILAALSRPTGSHEDAARACRLCFAMLRFWQIHGHFKTGLAACMGVLSDPSLPTDTPEHAGALHAAAVMAMKLGDLEQTERYSMRALAIARAHGDDHAAARSLNSLGNIAYFQGDLDTAERFHCESRDIHQRLDNTSGLSSSLNNLANIANDRGDLDRARTLYEQSLAINRESGNRASQAINLYNLALIAHHADRPEDALDLQHQAFDLREQIGDRFGVAESLCHLAWLALDREDRVAARRLHHDSLRIRTDLGDRLGICDSLDGVAQLASALERPMRAARVFGTVQALRNTLGASRPGWEQHALDHSLAPTRRSLGRSAFDAAVAAARTQPLGPFLDETLAWLATDSTPASTPPAEVEVEVEVEIDDETPTR